MPLRPRMRGLPVGRVPTRLTQTRTTAASAGHVAQDNEPEDHVPSGEEHTRSANDAARPDSTNTSPLTTAPSTRVSRTPRRGNTVAHASSRSKRLVTPTSNRTARSRISGVTPRQTSKKSRSRTPKAHANTQAPTAAPSRSSRKLATPTSHQAGPSRTTTLPPVSSRKSLASTSKRNTKPQAAKKAVGSARKRVGVSHSVQASPVVRRTPRHRKAVPTLPPSSPVAAMPSPANDIAKDVDLLPGTHLTLNDNGEIVPESPIQLTRGQKGKGRVGPAPQWKPKSKVVLAQETPSPEPPRRRKGTRAPALAPVAVTTPAYQKLAASGKVPPMRLMEVDELIDDNDEDDDDNDDDDDDDDDDDNDNEDGSYTGPGSQTALSPIKWNPYALDSGSQADLSPVKFNIPESWGIGAQPQSPDYQPYSKHTSISKRKWTAMADDGNEVDRPATRRRLEGSRDVSQGINTKTTSKHASLYGASATANIASASNTHGTHGTSATTKAASTSNTRGTHGMSANAKAASAGNNHGTAPRGAQPNKDNNSRATRDPHHKSGPQPPAVDLLQERTKFQRKLPNPATLMKVASAMQNRQQPASQRGNDQVTKQSQQHRPPPHRDSEDEDLMSDDEPHGEVTSQAVVPRRRQKRLDNIPPHHMGYYTPNTQAVLRAGKMFVTQLILTQDAYPRDTTRREMGKAAWKYAIDVEADAFAAASTQKLNDHIHRMFEDVNWKTRSIVKKAASLAVANCYGLKLSKVAEDDAARDDLASLVTRLLDQNRFLWFIPLPEHEDRSDPIPDDDVRRKASFYHPAISWTITTAIYKNATEETRMIYTPMPLQLLALAAAAIHCALSEWKTGFYNGIAFTEVAYRGLYSEYYQELEEFSQRKPGRCRNLCSYVTLACEEFIRDEPETRPEARSGRITNRNELFHYAKEGEVESDDPDEYEHYTI